ncbi:hypothetical protein ACEPPN_001079 [Leptodophora sp. 'Broadleaf-Isolate-01']
MDTATSAANNVASAPSNAIWGEPGANKVNDTGETSELKSPTKTTSKDVPASESASSAKADPVPEILGATKLEPLNPSGAVTPTPTETLESTHIAPLQEDGKEDEPTPSTEVKEKLHVGDRPELKTADVATPSETKTTELSSSSTPATKTETPDHKLTLKEKLKASGEKIKDKLHMH